MTNVTNLPAIDVAYTISLFLSLLDPARRKTGGGGELCCALCSGSMVWETTLSVRRRRMHEPKRWTGRGDGVLQRGI